MKSPLGIEPRLLALQTSMHPLYYGTLPWMMQKLFDSDCKRVGQKEPPPGCQVLKMYVGSNRVNFLISSVISAAWFYNFMTGKWSEAPYLWQSRYEHYCGKFKEATTNR